MEGPNLYEMLHDSEKTLSERQMLDVVIGIARGTYETIFRNFPLQKWVAKVVAKLLLIC